MAGVALVVDAGTKQRRISLMKVGDLVRRKPKWGEWVKYNPWMYTEKDLEIGVIVQTGPEIVDILWPITGLALEEKKYLEKINESR